MGVPDLQSIPIANPRRPRKPEVHTKQVEPP
jgi:hypothetical protein